MTPLWTADALVAATNGAMDVPFAATGVSIDTRTLQPGDLFIALVAEGDGHDHVATALERGAAGVMVHRTDGLAEDAPALLVPDTLEALQALGRAGRARFKGQAVAVTGSVGKTTTKEMLRAALSSFGATHAAEASYNNHWGVPLTLARLPPEAGFCVAEIGMNQAGEILPLARLAAPHVAVITTIASAHIGHLGSLEAIADEKAALLQGLQPGGFAVLPGDSAYLARMADTAPGVEIRMFGRAEGADARLLSARIEQEGTSVQARVAGRVVGFRMAAPGAHMAMNAMAALCACAALGLDPAVAAAALDGFAPVAGRGARRTIRGGSVVLLDESYNASAASVRAALSVLRGTAAQRRVAVLGDMLELGAFGPGEHAGLAEDVAASADLLYACGPLTRHLFDAVPPRCRGAHAGDSRSLAPVVAAAVQPGDAVLVKGSLGSRMRLVVAELESPAHAGGPA